MAYILDEYNIYGEYVLEFKEEILNNFKESIQDQFKFEIKFKEENVKQLDLIIYDAYTSGSKKEKDIIASFLDEHLLGFI